MEKTPKYSYRCKKKFISLYRNASRKRNEKIYETFQHILKKIHGGEPTRDQATFFRKNFLNKNTHLNYLSAREIFKFLKKYDYTIEFNTIFTNETNAR